MLSQDFDITVSMDGLLWAVLEASLRDTQNHVQKIPSHPHPLLHLSSHYFSLPQTKLGHLDVFFLGSCL